MRMDGWMEYFQKLPFIYPTLNQTLCITYFFQPAKCEYLAVNIFHTGYITEKIAFLKALCFYF